MCGNSRRGAGGDAFKCEWELFFFLNVPHFFGLFSPGSGFGVEYWPSKSSQPKEREGAWQDDCPW